MNSYEPLSAKNITRITYNYNPALSDGREIFSDNYTEYIVGNKDVIAIHECPSRGEGDKFFYDIEFEDTTILRVFNPHEVVFKFINPSTHNINT